MTKVPGQLAGRGRRSRVLTIGFHDEQPLPEPASSRDAIHVPDLFCAIGKLARATATEPIEALLINRASLNSMDIDTVRAAIRRIDPSVQVTVIETAEASPASPPATTNPTPANNTDLPADSDNHPLDVFPHASRQARTTDGSTLTRELHAVPHTNPAAHESATTIGDTDLLEALMNDPEGVRAKALAAITQYTGWRDVTLHHNAPPSNGHPAAPVTYANHTFGVLTSHQASEHDLSQWAQWLARWLYLDASYHRYRDLAYRDELTGAYNRRYFDEFLPRALKQAAKHRRPVTLMVLDIDDFKVYNDTFGHVAGDEILRETVRLLTSVIRKGDRVCRIGGDEFAVIFSDPEGPREAGSNHPENVEQIAQRFQEQICRMKFPKLAAQAPATLSVSAGLATYPWDGTTAHQLLRHADQLALQSKKRGKNAITLGPGAQQICRQYESNGDGLTK